MIDVTSRKVTRLARAGLAAGLALAAVGATAGRGSAGVQSVVVNAGPGDLAVSAARAWNEHDHRAWALLRAVDPTDPIEVDRLTAASAAVDAAYPGRLIIPAGCTYRIVLDREDAADRIVWVQASCLTDGRRTSDTLTVDVSRLGGRWHVASVDRL